jgi:uncharacterized membrane-anchored protein
MSWQRRLALILLLLPTLFLGGQIVLKEMERGSTQHFRMAIKGYDPRAYFSGHYLQFMLVPADDQKDLVKNLGPHRFYLAQDAANKIQAQLFKGEKKLSVLVYSHNNGSLSFDDLWIEGEPWREFIKHVK